MDTSLIDLVRTLKGHPFIATVGSFDGVHRGHRAVLDALCKEGAAKGLPSVVITFTGHPSQVLCDRGAPPLITPGREKLRLLERCGADALLVLPFTPTLASETMAGFVTPFRLSGLREMVLGYDSRFGSDAAHLPVDRFDREMERLGVPVSRVEPLLLAGREVSSSRIRKLLSLGDLPEAEELLGHAYSLTGRVEEGRQIGRTIGFPTANIRPLEGSALIPRDAIFAAEVMLEGVTRPAMAYYGTAPTITKNAPPDYRIEATLLDFEGDLYGREVTIAFRKMLREDRRFDTLEALREQLALDEASVRRFFTGHPLLL